jgi:hypothetical protein
VLLKKNNWLDGRQMMVSLTRCSNGVKTTLDAMDEQQPVRECEITGRRHGVPAAPEPSQLWRKLSLGAQANYCMIFEVIFHSVPSQGNGSEKKNSKEK